MTARDHGYARYKLDGCRCYVCGFAVAQYRDAREHAIRRGTWQPFVDAEPARAHIRNLQACGMGLRRIADLVGVDRKRLQAIVTGRPDRSSGPQERVRPVLASAILAVEPGLHNLASATAIDSTGTTRRLQALVAAGWPQAWLATALGMSPGNFGKVITSSQVTVRTARAVRVAYDELWRANPLEHGASQAGVTRAARYAVAHRWAPVGAWDDDAIDDPAAYPDWTGKCGTTGGRSAHGHFGIPMCDPCREAAAAHRRALREAQAAA